MSEYIIEMMHITKEFPGIVANDDITLQLKKGEIHALLGENGAGKSTLMSVLFGMYQPEKGEIRKNGEVVHIKDPNDAKNVSGEESATVTIKIKNKRTKVIGASWAKSRSTTASQLLAQEASGMSSMRTPRGYSRHTAGSAPPPSSA